MAGYQFGKSKRPRSNPFGITVELYGDEDPEEPFIYAAGFLKPFGEGHSMGWFMEGMLGPYLRKIHKERFRRGGDAASGKWAPLSTYSMNRRAAGRASGEYASNIRPGTPINRRTNELYEWVTESSWKIVPYGAGVGLMYPSTPPGSAELTEKVMTAQRGKSRPKTPPRPVLGIGPRQAQTMVTMMAAGLEDYVNRRGGIG